MIKKADKPRRNLRKDLSTSKWFLFVSPFWAVAIGLFLIETYGFIFGYTLEEMLTGTPILVFAVALFAIFAFCRMYIQLRALKKYLDALERNRMDDTVACGREFYSIERKGFLGLDGHCYTEEDDDNIAIDIETYCDL